MKRKLEKTNTNIVCTAIVNQIHVRDISEQTIKGLYEQGMHQTHDTLPASP